MKKFEALKLWVKRHVVKVFPIQFEVELKHPQPDDVNEGWYIKTISYCTTSRLKEIFKPLLAAAGLPCDFRRFDVWAEMALILKDRLETVLSRRDREIAFAKETLECNSVFKGKLGDLAKKLGINIKFKRAFFNRCQGYLERFQIQGSNLEIGFGCDRTDPEFSTANYFRKIGQYYGTFAIFDGDCKVVDMLNLESLENELDYLLSLVLAA